MQRSFLNRIYSITVPGLFLALLLTSFFARAQESVVKDTSGIDGTRLAIVGGAFAGSITAIHIYQQNNWWKEDRTRFHFREDLVYAKNVDKVGHVYGGMMLNFGIARSLQWANMPERQSIVWGGVGATLFQTYVEVEDGFSAWGFDRVDWASDLVGAWYPLLQHDVPFFKNLNMRFSYRPKNAGQAWYPGQTHTVFDDYDGQTLWLTLSMHNMLPSAVSGFWPDWLCLSVGMAVRNSTSLQFDRDQYLTWFIAPDLDLTKIIPQSTPLLRSIAELLNFIHMPMPALRFSPSVIWYGFYW
jgi:hypothetical protein